MTLKKIRLELARDRAHPEGSNRHGYEFVGPLDAEGRLDPVLWKKHRVEKYIAAAMASDGAGIAKLDEEPRPI